MTERRPVAAADRIQIIKDIRETRRVYELITRLTGLREWTTLVEIVEKQIASRELDALYMEPADDVSGRLRDRLIGTAEGMRLVLRIPHIISEDLKDFKQEDIPHGDE